MITFKHIATYLAEKPFQPFQIRMVSGRTFDIRHPEMILAGVSTIRVYTLFSDADDQGDQKWHDLSLTLIESIEPLEAGKQSNTP